MVYGRKNPYVIFKLPEAESISSYTIITANDNSRYPGRNPISWTLYGCNGQSSPDADSDQWQVIDSITEDTVLQNVNYTAYAFPVSGTVPAYQYYMLWVDEKESAILQLSELALSYEGSSFNFSVPQTTSSGSSSGGQGISTGIGLMCASCHGSGKDHCFTCRGTGFSGNHICFVCGGAGFKPCTACHGTGYLQ